MKNRTILFLIAATAIACRGERTVVEQSPSPAPAATTTVAGDPANLSSRTVEHVIPLVAPVARRCEVGSQLDASGVVSSQATPIASGAPMYLTIWLAESPPNLQVSMRVRNDAREEVALVTRPANGAMVLTLKLDQELDPGTYHVEGVWGGNVACEQEVEIVASP